MGILADILGYLGIACTLLIYQQKERRNLLGWKFICDCFWLGHYILIGASSAVAVTITALLRTLVFMNAKHKWAQGKAWLYVFLAVSLFFSILGWEGPMSLFVLVGSLGFTAAYWLSSPKRTRLVCIPACLLYLVYYIYIGSLQASICEIFIFISSIIGFVRHDLKRRM